MKTKIKIISNVLLSLLLGAQLLTLPEAIAQAIDITPADDAWCQAKTGESCTKALYDGKITTIDVINSRTAPAVAPAATAAPAAPTPAPAAATGTTLEDCTGSLTKPADESKCAKADAEAAAAETKAALDKADEEACAIASKAHFNNDIGLTCEQYRNALQTECKDKTKNLSPTGEQIQYSSCADKAAAEKNLRGQGFKLDLNALTLTSGGQKSGSAIFENKDYKQYGPLVGTLMRVIDMLILIIGSLAMLTLIIAGIFMIANHGDEAWVTKGKTMMLYSVLGLLAAFLSFAIVNVIQSALA